MSTTCFLIYSKKITTTPKPLFGLIEILLEDLYDHNLRNLYRPQFLAFEKSTLSHGKSFVKKHYGKSEAHMILYMMAVFHELIKDSMIEDYSKEEFKEVSTQYIEYLLEGISNERP